MSKGLFLAAALALPAVQPWAAEDPRLAPLQEYLEFAEYSDGAISTEQLSALDANAVLYVDTRNSQQFHEGHIPGAVNIEWREILTRRNEIPTAKTVVLYCETGLLSSRAYMALRLAGRDNVKVLWGGYLIWSAKQELDAARQPGIDRF